MMRESAVAMATPATPMRGAPSQPKINTALRNTFSTKATRFISMETIRRPTERSTERYTSITPQHR